jgi:hypothetical protein
VTATTAKTVAATPASTSTVAETVISDGGTIAYIGMKIGFAVVAAMAVAL